jgi:hypothetical protein
MGTATPENYSDDPVAAEMVEHGVRSLVDGDHPVMGSISVAQMARLAGVSDRTGYGKWDAEDLHVAIIRCVFEPDDSTGFDQLMEIARSVIESDQIQPGDDLALVFDEFWRYRSSDPGTAAAAALLPYCSGTGRIPSEIRAGLRRWYDAWGALVLGVIDAFVAKHAGKVWIRPDVSRKDMALLGVTLAEGFRAQALISDTESGERFSPSLSGFALKVLLASTLVYRDDPSALLVDERLRRLSGAADTRTLSGRPLQYSPTRPASGTT